jgi:predicted enzyme related to lactoylglutathione lyase
VDDLDAHLERFRAAGVLLRSDVVEGPGGRQFLVADPSGNLVEIFEPARG